MRVTTSDSYITYQAQLLEQVQELTGKSVAVSKQLRFEDLFQLKRVGRYLHQITNALKILAEHADQIRQRLNQQRQKNRQLVWREYFPYDFPLLLAYLFTALTVSIELLRYLGLAIFKILFDYLARKCNAQRVYRLLPLALLLVASFFFWKQLIRYYHSKNYLARSTMFYRHLLVTKQDFVPRFSIKLPKHGPGSHNLGQRLQKALRAKGLTISPHTRVRISKWLLTDYQYRRYYSIIKRNNRLSVYVRLKGKPVFCFQLDTRHQAAISHGKITAQLRRAFQESGAITLSPRSVVGPVEWLLTDVTPRGVRHYKITNQQGRLFVALDKRDLLKELRRSILQARYMLWYDSLLLERQWYYLVPMLIYYGCQLISRLGILALVQRLGEQLFPALIPAQQETRKLMRLLKTSTVLHKQLQQVLNYSKALQGALQAYGPQVSLEEQDLQRLNELFFREKRRLVHYTSIKDKVKQIFQDARQRQQLSQLATATKTEHHCQSSQNNNQQTPTSVSPALSTPQQPSIITPPITTQQEDFIYDLISPLEFEAELHNEICQQIADKQFYEEARARIALLQSLLSELAVPLLHSNPSLLLIAPEKFRTYFNLLNRVVNRIKARQLESLYDIQQHPDSFSHLYGLNRLEQDLLRTIADLQQHQGRFVTYHKKRAQYKRVILLGGEHYLKDKLAEIQKAIGGIKVLHYPDLMAIRSAPLRLQKSDLIVVYRRSIGHELIKKFEKQNRLSDADGKGVAKMVGFEQKNITILKNFLIDHCYTQLPFQQNSKNLK